MDSVNYDNTLLRDLARERAAREPPSLQQIASTEKSSQPHFQSINLFPEFVTRLAERSIQVIASGIATSTLLSATSHYLIEGFTPYTAGMIATAGLTCYIACYPLLARLKKAPEMTPQPEVLPQNQFRQILPGNPHMFGFNQ